MDLFKTSIIFFGHTISNVQISLQTHVVEFAEKFLEKITDKTQLQHFLGSLNCVSHFYKYCVKVRKVMNDRIEKDPMP